MNEYANPTQHLKSEISKKKNIILNGQVVALDGLEYSKETKSMYTNSRDVPYDLSSVAQLYLCKDMDHGEYLYTCRENGIPPISFIDRERILTDLFVAPVAERKKIPLFFRETPIKVQEYLQRYEELKKKRGTGTEYIVLPSYPEKLYASIKKLLITAPEVKLVSKTEITYGERRYIFTRSPEEIDSFCEVAAFFIDGSSSQFREWPEETMDALKVTPSFFLFLEDQRKPIPTLPKRTVVLRARLDSPLSLEIAATEFWSRLGCRSQ
ncbi:hypothetical protein NEFER03_0141 [Nematocida sp. LUAm3]|nr:hypothetical protein NEFER03_0141 [Nematocida sp. LUAm3]KAI5173594.1 hypothetical protein NEFER02_0110 [Nematocida sp. LUAm2]KAI5176815.1 hypothetical protein NEFER01_0140 [Nematocida sp. LUAm1]